MPTETCALQLWCRTSIHGMHAGGLHLIESKASICGSPTDEVGGGNSIHHVLLLYNWRPFVCAQDIDRLSRRTHTAGIRAVLWMRVYSVLPSHFGQRVENNGLKTLKPQHPEGNSPKPTCGNNRYRWYTLSRSLCPSFVFMFMYS